ncbi:MAG: hypothetical protein JXR10_02990 [Cyclobacteriaceae bacterium]
MNKLLFLLFSVLSLNVKAQTEFFEGRISLKLQYFDSLNNEISAETLGRDTEMHYFVAEGNYKSLNEKGVITQLFNSSTNKYFFNNQGQIQVMDASFKFPQTGNVKLLEGEVEILERKCSKLTIESESDFTTYYYSPELPVNTEFYQKHNFGNWNLFLNSTDGALALRYEIKYPNAGLTVLMEAYEVEEIDMSLEDFNIEIYLEK